MLTFIKIISPNYILILITINPIPQYIDWHFESYFVDNLSSNQSCRNIITGCSEHNNILGYKYTFFIYLFFFFYRDDFLFIYTVIRSYYIYYIVKLLCDGRTIYFLVCGLRCITCQ